MSYCEDCHMKVCREWPVICICKPQEFACTLNTSLWLHALGLRQALHRALVSPLSTQTPKTSTI